MDRLEMLRVFLTYSAEYLRTGAEITILALLIYSVLYFLRGTRGAPVLAGFTIVTLLLTFVSRFLGLEVIEWLTNRIWALFSIAALVIFQPEIRRAFAEIGSSQARLRSAVKRARETMDVLLDSAFFLADRRIGALIAIQQEIGMRGVAETGTLIRAPLSQALLTTFFYPRTPLHDGGVIVHGDEIVAAGCIFPLTQDPDLSKNLGTRHRAGVGITEETDALVIIVSEESGGVSLAYRGRLVRGLSRERLERRPSVTEDKTQEMDAL
jgi:diadenylate cyclase